MLIQMVLCSVIHVLQLFKITSDIINLSIFKAKKSIALDPEIFGQDAGSGRLRETHFGALHSLGGAGLREFGTSRSECLVLSIFYSDN